MNKHKSDNSFITNIHTFITQHQLLPKHSTIILGLSGGPDSVFLLHILQEYQRKGTISLIAAHLDHQWRPNSAEDVLFCQHITQKLSIPFVSGKASELPAALKKHGSQEEIGRRMRRFFLEQVREQHNADFIALAHHAQDQQETFFIRLIRGTTLSGLVGMKPKEGVYIRPLLETNKPDILNYLHNNTISYLEDPTNIAESFLRNRIRKHVLPALQECDARFDANFLRTQQHLKAAEEYLTQLTTIIFAHVATLQDDAWYLDIKKLEKHPLYMQNRLIMQWLIAEHTPFTPTEQFLDEIKKFLFTGKDGTHQLHHAWVIIKKKDSAYIAHKS